MNREDIGSAVVPPGVEVLALLGDSPQVQVRDNEPVVPHNRWGDPRPVRYGNARAAAAVVGHARLLELGMEREIGRHI